MCISELLINNDYVHFHSKCRQYSSILTCPPVGSLTTLLSPDGPGSHSGGEDDRSRLITFVAMFASALMGGEVRGRDVICASVIFEGLKVGRTNLQPEFICAFKFFMATNCEHEDLSQEIRRSPSTLDTTSGTFV